MTKQQVLKQLASLGYTVAATPEGKFAANRFSAWIHCPDGIVGLFDPRDLLAEIRRFNTLLGD